MSRLNNRPVVVVNLTADCSFLFRLSHFSLGLDLTVSRLFFQIEVLQLVDRAHWLPTNG